MVEDSAPNWQELFEQYRGLVFKTAYLMLGNRDAAEDVLQEVFLRLPRWIPAYQKDRGRLSTWIHRITINQCISDLRLRRAFPGKFWPVEAGTDPDEQWEIREALGRLSRKLRAVIVLRYFHDLPYAEIARILKVPLGTVKSRLSEAVRILRDSLEPFRETAEPTAAPTRRVR
jgi:RNA polymerase sigma-70 factor (ECF subfamily)